MNLLTMAYTHCITCSDSKVASADLGRVELKRQIKNTELPLWDYRTCTIKFLCPVDYCCCGLFCQILVCAKLSTGIAQLRYLACLLGSRERG